MALMCVGFFLHELNHFHRYGHFAPLELHADVSIAASNDVALRALRRFIVRD